MDGPPGFGNHRHAHFERALKPARRVSVRERRQAHMPAGATRDRMLGAW